MSIYQGAYFSQTFSITAAGIANDITGWTFESDIRTHTAATEALLTLTTANGGWTVTSGPSGLLQMQLTAAQTALLPAGRVVFDVMRTDGTLIPVRYFGGSVKVKQPVTR